MSLFSIALARTGGFSHATARKRSTFNFRCLRISVNNIEEKRRTFTGRQSGPLGIQQTNGSFVTLENVSVTAFENDNTVDHPAIVNVVSIVAVIDVPVFRYLKLIGIIF